MSIITAVGTWCVKFVVAKLFFKKFTIRVFATAPVFVAGILSALFSSCTIWRESQLIDIITSSGACQSSIRSADNQNNILRVDRLNKVIVELGSDISECSRRCGLKIGTHWESDTSELRNNISARILSSRATRVACAKCLETLAQKQDSKLSNDTLALRLTAGRKEKSEFDAETTYMDRACKVYWW